MARIPVSILTGFLGSGKTTLLNRALAHPELAHTAVIVNEFGEIGLDHDLVQQSDDAVVLLANGCLCCSVKSDLVSALDDLFQRRLQGTVPAFDRVVIETSGLAEPTPVIEVLISEPTISARYAMDDVTATVDVVNGIATLEAHLESAKQIALADQIILTKTDMAPSQDSVDVLHARLRALNPIAPILDSHSITSPADLLSGRSGAANPPRYIDKIMQMTDPQTSIAGRFHRIHDNRIRTFTIVRDTPVSMQVLELFLSSLASNLGPELLRVKGLIHVAEHPEGPAVIQGAQRLLHGLTWLPAWPSDDRRTRIVFITLETAVETVPELFELTERMARRR
ncbi:MAG: GTP-binding protein [Steroidobacteraceae bacterium]